VKGWGFVEVTGNNGENKVGSIVNDFGGGPIYSGKGLGVRDGNVFQRV
jgi:hypothetical protein